MRKPEKQEDEDKTEPLNANAEILTGNRHSDGHKTAFGRGKLGGHASSLLIVIIGLMLSLGTGSIIKMAETERIRFGFERLAQARCNLFEQCVGHYLHHLESFRLLFDSSQFVNRDEFITAAKAMIAPHSDPLVFSWAPRGPAIDRRALEETALAEGSSVVAQHEEYYTILYNYPWTERGVGTHMSCSPLWREAIERARDSGELAISSLSAAPGHPDDQIETAAFLPVYRKGVDTRTVEERRTHIEGVLMLRFRLTDVLNKATMPLDPGGVDMDVRDVSAPGGRQLLARHKNRLGTGDADHTQPKEDNASTPTYTTIFDIGGQRWEMHCTASRAYQSTQFPLAAHWIALLAGAFITTLAAKYNYDLRNRAADLRQSEAMLNAAGKLTKVGGWIVDAKTRDVRSTGKAYHILDIPTGGLLPLNEVLTFFHPSDRPKLEQAMQRAIEFGEPYDMEIRLITARGTHLWTRVICRPMIADGKTVSLVGAIQNITEQKEDQNRLRNLRSLLETVISNANVWVMALDRDGDVIIWNKTAERISGYSREDVTGEKGIWDVLHPDEKYRTEVISRYVQAIKRTGRVANYETIITRKDGGTRTVSWNATELDVDPSVPLRYVLVGQDVTDLKKAEEERERIQVELLHAQKLESVGRLAAGIAHEINTPAQYVGDNTHFLQDTFARLMDLLSGYRELLKSAGSGKIAADRLIENADGLDKEMDLAFLSEEIPKSIEQSLDGLTRVTTIVRAMKDFSHPGSGERRPANINKSIESTVTVARNEWKYVSEIEMNLDPMLPEVPCLQDEFNQVILNMIVNAAHAIAGVVGDGAGGKGTITITSRRDGDWVEVRIADTGTGMPESLRAKIFEPFFTTKEVGKGTGQGLAIARSVIVDKHGGTIDLETEEGRGTTFVIRLPLNETKPLEEVIS